MPIDKSVFAELFNALAEYYNRKASPPIAKAWYRAIGNQLTTEQFQDAFEQVVCSEEFMPTPKKFLELVKGSPESNALDEWEKCLAAAARGESSVVSELSASGQFALRSIGGFKKLEMSDPVKDHHWLMKKFVEAWQSLPAAQQLSLPMAQDAEFLPAAEIQALTSKMSMNGNGKYYAD
jgi:hypothetical protein